MGSEAPRENTRRASAVIVVVVSLLLLLLLLLLLSLFAMQLFVQQMSLGFPLALPAEKL